MKSRGLVLCIPLLVFACGEGSENGDSGGPSESESSNGEEGQTESETVASSTPGDGDGDTTAGDGDGDTTAGDGDGDTAAGDGDGDGGGDGDGAPDCDDALSITYAPSGLPLVESNPGAPVALFLDFDGGIYHNSSDENIPYIGYSDDDDYDTFSATEQEDILRSFTFVSRYYAMFDVNVTTDDAVREATGKWGWILISNEASGGSASTSNSAIGTEPYARAYAGSSTVEPGNQDRSRRLAHELGHNFTLHHSGVWDNGSFYKWEDWPQWDGVYGPIMGGGGEGQRNGWSFGAHSEDMTTDQDTMEIIRQRVISVGGSSTGWREDDFADPAPLCQGQGELYREAVLGRPDDEDRFTFDWPGGDMTIEEQTPEVSAALLDIQLYLDGEAVGGEGTNTGLAAGSYELRVSSEGGYAEIGSYRVAVK
jgi:hypothetical protein